MVEIKNFLITDVGIAGGCQKWKQLSITIQTDTPVEMDNVRKRICAVLSEDFSDTDSYGNTIKKG